ncbi:MAG TPA: NADH-quinone oxidoreductase subunit C [Candidatus Kapabacteria bacterium]|nr:NADH-quinone oxidoreductase subunit C [Candidatus Kapabacteria bacterium]
MTSAERLEQVKNAVLPVLAGHFGSDTFSVTEHRNELSITVPRERLLEVADVLKNTPSLHFDMLKDVCAVDWNRRRQRFELIYNFWSLDNNYRLRVKCFTEEKAPHVDSLVPLYGSANWYEREAYDMHGIIFDGHPDLRRMYMPEDFLDPVSGEPLYPLRKDFPMMGIPGSLPLPERKP